MAHSAAHESEREVKRLNVHLHDVTLKDTSTHAHLNIGEREEEIKEKKEEEGNRHYWLEL